MGKRGWQVQGKTRFTGHSWDWEVCKRVRVKVEEWNVEEVKTNRCKELEEKWVVRVESGKGNQSVEGSAISNKCKLSVKRSFRDDT